MLVTMSEKDIYLFKVLSFVMSGVDSIDSPL